MSKSSPLPTPTAIGFGAHYFLNFGGTTTTKLQHVLQGPENQDEPQELLLEDDHDDDDDDDDFHDHNKLLDVEAHTFTNPHSPPPPWDVQEDPLVEIATSSGSTMFLTKHGKIYTVGTLHGRVRESITRTLIQLPLMAVQIAAGRHFCLARMEGGLAVCSWGAGHFGQLGLGDARPFAEHPTVMEGLLPQHVGSPVVEVVAGAWHGMALTEGGQVWAWGCNRSNQCGRKKLDPTASSSPPTMVSPQLVPLDKPVAKLAAGKAHSVALDRKGSVYCWGASNYSQCGGLARRRTGIAPPILVDALAKVQIVDIAAGDLHSLALTGGGRVFAWGGGAEGQLGAGTWCALINPKPKLVGDLDFVAIQAGVEWKAKQRTDEGDNKSGGTFTPAGEAQPSPPSDSNMSSHALASIPKITSVHASGNYSVACSSSGHVYSWGSNDVGQLGVPKPDRDTLVFVEPGQQLPKRTTLRQFHTQSFDSSHNVALPQRVDCISGYHITSVALSPTSMWCIGTKRPENEQPPVMVGRTLYECQEVKRRRSLARRRKSASSASASASDPNSSSPASLKATLDTELSSALQTMEVSQSQDSCQDSMSSIVPSDAGEDSPRQKTRRRLLATPLRMIKKLSNRGSHNHHHKAEDTTSGSQLSETANDKGGRKFFS
jgi:alpha-tubulin suppressor-like RCC1 family protein